MKKRTIEEIEHQLFGASRPELKLVKELRNDSRKGVQKLVARWDRLRQQERASEQRFAEMTVFERKLRQQGFQLIAGVDEVGRGPLAGPVVAAAVILPEDFYLPGLNDSKQLSEQKREEFFEIISGQAAGIGIGLIGAEEIDRINIYEASKKAMLQAISSMETKPDYLLIDAVPLTVPYPSQSIIKGDAKSISIAAASVIAKVTRDRIMKKAGEEYPAYSFEQNMGYGTAAHLAALKEYGVTPLHRKSFAPVRELLGI